MILRSYKNVRIFLILFVRVARETRRNWGSLTRISLNLILSGINAKLDYLRKNTIEVLINDCLKSYATLRHRTDKLFIYD